MVEVDRTRSNFDSKFASLDRSKIEGKIFEQKETKLTKWRKTRSDFSSFWDHPGAFAVQEVKTRNDHENDKSVEVDRTRSNFDSKFASLDRSKIEGKIFEQKETKLTKWRKTRSDFSSFWDHPGAFAVQEMKTRNDHENDKSVELGRTRSNRDKLERDEKNGRKPMNYAEWSKSIELDQTLTQNCFRWHEWVLYDR